MKSLKESGRIVHRNSCANDRIADYQDAVKLTVESEISSLCPSPGGCSSQLANSRRSSSANGPALNLLFVSMNFINRSVPNSSCAGLFVSGIPPCKERICRHVVIFSSCGEPGKE